MGKIKELFEIEDAHTFAEVGKRKAKKIFKDAELQEKVLTVLQNEGKVFANNEKKQGFNITGIAIGVLFGISFGSSLDNWTLGIPMAFMWAMVFSMVFNAEATKLVKRGE